MASPEENIKGAETSEPQWRAYVDESESNRQLDPDTYILAAALVHDAQADRLRERLTALRPRGQSKLHWHAESPRSRATIAKTIADLAAMHLVVIRACGAGEPVERRRRKCLERLAYELGTRSVRHITVEAREPKQDARELQHFNDLRSAHRIDTEMRLYHAAGPVEPLLWLADAVAGAVTAARTGEPGYLDTLAHIVDLVTLDYEP